jgi:molybdate transport system permease protein
VIRVSGARAHGVVSRGFIAVCVAVTVLLSTLVLVALCTVLIVPFAALRQALAGGALWMVVKVSLQTSVTAALLALVLGTPVAYVLASKEFSGKAVVETLLDLPVVLPPLVAGLALLILVSPHSPFGKVLAGLGVSLIFTRKGIVLAQLFVALPFYIRAACSAMRAIPPSLPAAASVLRATEAYTFFHVVLPLSREGIISGFVMCWTRALGEFGATAMVAGCIPGVTETLPIFIYTRATAGDLVSAGVAAFCLAVVSSVTLVGLRVLFGGTLLRRKA